MDRSIGDSLGNVLRQDEKKKEIDVNELDATEQEMIIEETPAEFGDNQKSPFMNSGVVDIYFRTTDVADPQEQNIMDGLRGSATGAHPAMLDGHQDKHSAQRQ